MHLDGSMSTFGGPYDMGVRVDEGLALIDRNNFATFVDCFLSAQPVGTTGLARRLDPNTISRAAGTILLPRVLSCEPGST